MNDQIIIRQENGGDFKKVFELNKNAFGQTNEAKLVDTLRNNPKVFIPKLSMVATYNNQLVGYILFTKIHIMTNNKSLHESLALAPMAVIPKLQNKGIGGQLIKKGFDVAKELGFKSVIVLGHEQYYPKFGFKPSEKWDIKAPFEVPPNAFMAIELVKSGLKVISGTVIYPKEFETV